MIQILLSGALGHMGRVIAGQMQTARDTFQLAGGIDIGTDAAFSAPLFSSAEAVNIPFDVCIDFSVPAAALQALSLCVREKKPIVIATTGFTETQRRTIAEAAEKIPVFFTGNMSLGVNLQVALAKQAAAVLGEAFDIEIVEAHHNLKKDAPSGTALMLANALSKCGNENKELVFGRHGGDCRRQKNEIGIHSLRGGTLCGEHTVRFLGTDEEIEITHRAYSKAIFAKGALSAAAFIAKMPAGLYDMNNLLNGR